MYTIELSWPPSVNQYWEHVYNAKLRRVQVFPSKAALSFKVQTATLVRKKGAPPRFQNAIQIEIDAYPPDRRKRDSDNIVKATFDALTYSNVWRDDYQVVDFRVRRFDETGDKLIVRITELAQLPLRIEGSTDKLDYLRA